VRALAPGGAGAVFDTIGGPGLDGSFRLLAPGGTLVSYGSAATKNDAGGRRLPALLLGARTTWWNLLPSSGRALFYNFWAGKRKKADFQARLREDLTPFRGPVPCPARVSRRDQLITPGDQIGGRLPSAHRNPGALERAGEPARAVVAADRGIPHVGVPPPVLERSEVPAVPRRS
jgi:hypothetical protein